MVRYILGLLLVLFITSCSNLSLESDQVFIESIKDGSQLKSGDRIPISFYTTTEEVIPTSMNIAITTINSITRAPIEEEPSFYEVDLLQDPEVELSINNSDGLYRLDIEMFENGESIANKSLEFSVFSGSIFKEIVGVLPDTGLYTDSYAILEADIISTEVDPYIVWSQGEEILKEGYLSDGLNRYIWESSDKLGFNSIDMELFPYKFTNKTESNSSLVFKTLVNDLSMTLFESINYYKAHLFNGNYVDEFYKDGEVVVLGDIKPEKIENFYGMAFAPGREFTMDRSMIPFSEESINSFSLLMNLKSLSEADGSVFKDSLFDLNSSLTIEDGEYVFNINDSSENILSVEAGSEIKFVISYIFNEDVVDVLFYGNGQPLGTISYDYTLNREALPSFSIGGFESADFLIDSFMVYYFDGERNNIYQDNVYDRDEDVTFAQGFNSLYLPEEVEGDASVDGEYLILENEATLDIGSYLENEVDYELIIKLKEASKYKLLITSEEEAVEKSLSGDLEIKRRGDSLFFYLGELIEEVKIIPETIVIESVDKTAIDEIVVFNRESLEKI